MKSVKIITAAAALSILSFGAFAAEEINSDQLQTGQYHEMGRISASGDDVASLQQNVNMKADADGATAYDITNVTGGGGLHGVATLYK